MTTTRGQPATTVNVEIDPAKLEEEIGEFAGVKHVTAEFPDTAAGWRFEEMHKAGHVVRGSGAPIERYTVTHYGPSDSHDRGVGVTIDTGAGPVAAQQRGEAYSVGEVDKPSESHKVPSPTRRRRRSER